MKRRHGSNLTVILILPFLLVGCQAEGGNYPVDQSVSSTYRSVSWYVENGRYEMERIEGPFSVEIDLLDPDSNKGKVLYQVGACSIYIDQVYYDDPRQVNSVFLRFTYEYDENTGVRAAALHDITNSFSSDCLPVFFWDGNEDGFKAQLRGYGGGLLAQVGFYFPNDQGDPILLPDTVALTFSNIYIHTWT